MSRRAHHAEDLARAQREAAAWPEVPVLAEAAGVSQGPPVLRLPVRLDEVEETEPEPRARYRRPRVPRPDLHWLKVQASGRLLCLRCAGTYRLAPYVAELGIEQWSRDVKQWVRKHAKCEAKR